MTTVEGDEFVVENGSGGTLSVGAGPTVFKKLCSTHSRCRSCWMFRAAALAASCAAACLWCSRFRRARGVSMPKRFPGCKFGVLSSKFMYTISSCGSPQSSLSQPHCFARLLYRLVSAAADRCWYLFAFLVARRVRHDGIGVGGGGTSSSDSWRGGCGAPIGCCSFSPGGGKRCSQQLGWW